MTTSISPPSISIPNKVYKNLKLTGSLGHKGNSRELYPTEDYDDVENHRPQVCANCGEMLTGEDPNPLRY
jgi:hypothetical protein